jgi:membrane-associated phospholipid phosphatase
MSTRAGPRSLDVAVPVVLVGAAFGLAAATVKGRGRVLDDRLFKWFNSSLQRPGLDHFFKGITELGSLWASIGAAGALAVRGRRRQAADALAAAATTWVMGQVLKKAWQRVRPFDAGGVYRLLILKPRGASWPSSHPMVLTAFLTVASRNLGLGGAARVGVGTMAGLVACSRLYLGVHYPADVAGGLLLGRALGDAWSRAVSPRLVR